MATTLKLAGSLGAGSANVALQWLGQAALVKTCSFRVKHSCKKHRYLMCRVLDPMPLNPGARRVASAHLKQPRRPRPKQAAVAQGLVNANGTGPAADAAGKKGRGRKRKSAESVESHEAPDSYDNKSRPPEAGASKSNRGKGRKAPTAKTVSAEQDVATKPSDREAQQPNQDCAAGKGGKGRGKRGKQNTQQQQQPDPQLEDDLAAACAASLEHARQNSAGSSLSQKAKRVGDIELENQLAMAMASTAAEAQHKVQRKPSMSAVHDEPMPSTLSPKAAVAKPTLGETWARDARLPQQDVAQSDAASHWAEVFCGSAELGKWIHVDPLLKWLDVPDKVEGAGIRLAQCTASMHCSCKEP